jgi:type IV pilus biogenesis protein CpaD/CtpE
MLNDRFADFAVIRKGVDVRAMAAAGKNRRWVGFLPPLMAAALAACAGLPAIGGQQLPQDTSPAAPIVYRDLADIPEAPPVSPAKANQEAIQSLMMDRAKTAQTTEDLRQQPFNMPDPSTSPGF